MIENMNSLFIGTTKEGYIVELVVGRAKHGFDLKVHIEVYRPMVISLHEKKFEIRKFLKGLSKEDKFDMCTYYNCSPIGIENEMLSYSEDLIFKDLNLDRYICLDNFKDKIWLDFLYRFFSTEDIIFFNDDTKELTNLMLTQNGTVVPKNYYNTLDATFKEVSTLSKGYLQKAITEFLVPSIERVALKISSITANTEDDFYNYIVRAFGKYEFYGATDVMVSSENKDSFSLCEGWHSAHVNDTNAPRVYFHIKYTNNSYKVDSYQILF